MVMGGCLRTRVSIPLQLTFDENLLVSEEPPMTSVHMPVARALFKATVSNKEDMLSSPAHTEDQFSFSAQQIRKTTKRKKALVLIRLQRIYNL